MLRIALRDETEWVEMVQAGSNVLAGADTARITAAVREYLREKHAALQAQRLALWKQAQADAQAIIEMIARRYDPQ